MGEVEVEEVEEEVVAVLAVAERRNRNPPYFRPKQCGDHAESRRRRRRRTERARRGASRSSWATKGPSPSLEEWVGTRGWAFLLLRIWR